MKKEMCQEEKSILRLKRVYRKQGGKNKQVTTQQSKNTR